MRLIVKILDDPYAVLAFIVYAICVLRMLFMPIALPTENVEPSKRLDVANLIDGEKSRIDAKH